MVPSFFIHPLASSDTFQRKSNVSSYSALSVIYDLPLWKRGVDPKLKRKRVEQASHRACCPGSSQPRKKSRAFGSFFMKLLLSYQSTVAVAFRNKVQSPGQGCQGRPQGPYLSSNLDCPWGHWKVSKLRRRNLDSPDTSRKTDDNGWGCVQKANSTFSPWLLWIREEIRHGKTCA